MIDILVMSIESIKHFFSNMKTTLTIDDDGILTFPDEMIGKLGWKEGDVLVWTDLGDGSFSLKKKDET